MALIDTMKYLLLIVFILLSAQASAYIDPGTGGAIIGSGGAMITAIFGLIGMFVLKYLISPLKKGVSKIREFIKKR